MARQDSTDAGWLTAALIYLKRITLTYLVLFAIHVLLRRRLPVF